MVSSRQSRYSLAVKKIKLKSWQHTKFGSYNANLKVIPGAYEYLIASGKEDTYIHSSTAGFIEDYEYINGKGALEEKLSVATKQVIANDKREVSALQEAASTTISSGFFGLYNGQAATYDNCSSDLRNTDLGKMLFDKDGLLNSLYIFKTLSQKNFKEAATRSAEVAKYRETSVWANNNIYPKIYAEAQKAANKVLTALEGQTDNGYNSFLNELKQVAATSASSYQNVQSGEQYYSLFPNKQQLQQNIGHIFEPLMEYTMKSIRSGASFVGQYTHSKDNIKKQLNNIKGDNFTISAVGLKDTANDLEIESPTAMIDGVTQGFKTGMSLKFRKGNEFNVDDKAIASDIARGANLDKSFLKEFAYLYNNVSALQTFIGSNYESVAGKTTVISQFDTLFNKLKRLVVLLLLKYSFYSNAKDYGAPWKQKEIVDGTGSTEIIPAFLLTPYDIYTTSSVYKYIINDTKSNSNMNNYSLYSSERITSPFTKSQLSKNYGVKVDFIKYNKKKELMYDVLDLPYNSRRKYNFNGAYTSDNILEKALGTKTSLKFTLKMASYYTN